ncbi:MAG: hypothetical protein LBN95_02235 [Prevotellaceae bacterium]|jgi:hypothetical protein|nr:hypothetical protein [Prevotellaceae bacterium]
MKKFIYISVTAICFSAIAGCQKSDGLSSNNDNKQTEVSQKMLFRGQTNYAKILNHDGEIVGYLSTKQNSIDAAEMFFKMPSQFAKQDATQELLKDMQPTRHIGFAVNNMNVKDLTQNLQPLQPANTQFFGNEVSFSLFNENSTSGVMKTPANDETSSGTIKMYVPELLNITSPNIATPEDLLPYCYYKDFVLGWNADPKNENGLVVVVEWHGMDIYGNEYKKYVRNADIITNDNGQAVLNNKLFDGIPQGALVNLQLIRGSIEIVGDFTNEEGKTEEFRLVAATQAILPFILVREIEN